MHESHFLPEEYHIRVIDGGAGTFVLGKGREVININNSRRENVVSSDHETTM
jgi:hypothetical protein